MINEVIIEEFSKLINFIQEQINDALLKNDNKWINKTYFQFISRVFQSIKRYDQKITLDNLKDVGTLSGIGKGSLKRIEEILTKGKLSEIKDLLIKGIKKKCFERTTRSCWDRKKYSCRFS